MKNPRREEKTLISEISGKKLWFEIGLPQKTVGFAQYPETTEYLQQSRLCSRYLRQVWRGRQVHR